MVGLNDGIEGRHKISLKSVPLEVRGDMTASWEESTLPTIVSNYDLPDMYNADEFGIFYKTD